MSTSSGSGSHQPKSHHQKSQPNVGLALGAIGLGGFAADYLLSIGLSRLLDTHAYGDYRVAQSFVSLAGIAVLLGGDRAAPMVVSGRLEKGELGAAWEYLRFYLRLGVLLSFGVIVLTWIASALHIGSSDPQHHHAVPWMVVAVPVIAAGAMISRGLQSARRHVLAALPWRVGFPLLKLALLVLVARVAGGLDLHTAVVIGIGATVIVTVVQWRVLRRLVFPVLERDPSASSPRDWLTASVPMMGAFLVSVVLNQSDLYFLEILGDDEEVGHYAAASTSAHFLLIIQATVVGFFAPRLRPALDQSAEAGRKIYREGLRVVLLAVIPAAVALVLGAKPILSVFGPSFVTADVELGWLVVGNTAWATAALAALWLQYTGRASLTLAVTIATLVFDSALNLALIPHLGMHGAALSTAASMALAAAFLVILRRRTLRAL